MKITQEMVHAAVNEAVAQGLLPKTANGEAEYLKMHEQIAAVLRAAGPRIEVHPAAELMDTHCGAVIFGASGVGKSSALIDVIKRHFSDSGNRRHCLAVTYRDDPWVTLGVELQSKRQDFSICDREFDFNQLDVVGSGIVFCNAADPTKLPLQILRWGVANAHSCPTLIIDDCLFQGAESTVESMLFQLPLGVQVIWCTSSVDRIPSHLTSRIDRIVAMQTDPRHRARAIAHLAIELDHPEVNAFSDAAQTLKPYQAIAYTRLAAGNPVKH